MKLNKYWSLSFMLIFLLLGIIAVVLLVVNLVDYSKINQISDLGKIFEDEILNYKNKFNILENYDIASKSIETDGVLTYMIWKSNIHNQNIFQIVMGLFIALSWSISIVFGIKTYFQFRKAKVKLTTV